MWLNTVLNFDISYQSKLKLRRKRKNKIVETFTSKGQVFKHRPSQS